MGHDPCYTSRSSLAASTSGMLAKGALGSPGIRTCQQIDRPSFRAGDMLETLTVGRSSVIPASL